ncbi:MAG TPA: recombinase family protein [Vicinamibacterales bacterium]|nr:recombinase family protein [Vicinamibacterales bacterium]
MPTPTRCALYLRVSTTDQHTENQALELRQFAAARGWTIVREYEDAGVSGAKESRPALNAMLQDARRRKFDVLVCWRLDRLGRNLRHLVLLLDELHALGVSFASLNEGIDATTPAGRLQMHMLAALSEFERGRIQERVRAGLARARANGRRLGRPAHRLSADDIRRTAHLTTRAAARELRVSPALVHKLRSQIPADFRPGETPESADVSEAGTTVHKSLGL